jgi:ribosomal protein S18 acetylase RimI-like enzyme
MCAMCHACCVGAGRRKEKGELDSFALAAQPFRMTDRYTLRLIAPGDAAALHAADIFDGPVQPAYLAAFLASPAHLLAVAFEDTTPVGFASGLIALHPDKAAQLYIIEVGVNDPAQRQGLATRLVTLLRAEGRKRGCSSSYVLTEQDNTAARALYHRLGGREMQGVVMYDWEDTPGDQSGKLE